MNAYTNGPPVSRLGIRGAAALEPQLGPADARDLPYSATSVDSITLEEAAWLQPARQLLAAPELRYRPVVEMLTAFGGGPLAYPNFTNLDHALQTATRAFRAGESEEYVAMALLHDVADYVSFGTGHGDMAALIMGPFLSDMNVDVLRSHVGFQDYYRSWVSAEARQAREKMRGHPAFEETVRFCENYDQASFDPQFASLPLAAFEPMVQRLFMREPKIRRRG